MKSLSKGTRVYLVGTLLVGTALLVWNMQFLDLEFSRLMALLVLIVAASLAQIFKVEGTTNRSHYAISFVVYGFCLLRLGLPETMLVILVSNLAEWLRHRSPWFIAAFNTACYIIVIQIAFLVYLWIDPTISLQGLTSVIAILLAMLTYTLLNHLMVGTIIWLARGENFAQSGIFNFLPLTIDLTMLVMGASLDLVWNYNAYAVLLFLIPVYLIYSTLRVPALERKTEIDQKTGVFNHAYFMQQLGSELVRADRYDRPLTVIMTDLDLLRNINNSYGHLAGDEVLKGVAAIIQKTVREYDVVARFGGEEFVILMPETTKEVGFERAEQIRKAIEQADFPIPTSVTPIQVTISLGVAGREYARQGGEEIIHNADMALYHSKLKGRNQTYVYDSGMFAGLFPGMGEAPVAAENTGAAPAAAHTNTAPASNVTQHGPIPQRMERAPQAAASAAPQRAAPSETPEKAERDLCRVTMHTHLFIGAVAAAALALFLLLFHTLPVSSYLGLGLFVLAVVLTELFSIDIYVRETAVSTSAAPLLAGTLLFGPPGVLVLSLAFALTAYFRSRGPLNRVVFNFSNQLIAGMLYLGLLLLTPPFASMPYYLQALFSICAMMITYLVTTSLIAIGISINSGQKISSVWYERFSWLAPYYLVMGLVAYALVYGYATAEIFGVLAILAPLMMLRWSQKQYLDRTRTMVLELREKNLSLEKSTNEITTLNNGLLDILAEVVDLRDCYVLGHSRQVTQYAVLIAKALGLHEQQIDLIRRASLLHDLGKLGISERILSKPENLTDEEYQVIKMHPIYGARLLEKSSLLMPLVPVVKHHHEHFDGSGYPDGLCGSGISMEARIVAVADAIEAMASDRSYRKAIPRAEIIAELRCNAGTQFDPQVAAVAVHLLESGSLVLNRLHTDEKKVQRYTFAK